MSDSIRSPQADILDELVWSKISSFWSQRFDDSDKQALSAVYEAFFHVQDAEYIRLFEVNRSKSIVDCPVFTQRRWLRIDLNRYKELKAFLQFLRAGISQTSLNNSRADTLDCVGVPTNHARHWHISFKWVIPSGDVVARKTINLSYPISTTLADIYRMTPQVDGTIVGTRLVPQADYDVIGDGTSLRLTRDPAPGEIYEVMVGLDLSGSAYQSVRPLTVTSTTFVGGNSIQVPSTLLPGFPAHVMVIRNAPTGGGALTATNRSDFQTRRYFFPFGPGGAQHGALGQVVIPGDFPLQPGDVAQVFGVEAGTFDTLHAHQRDSRVLNADNANPGGQLTYVPNTVIQPGIFGPVGYLAQQLQLFVRGELLDPDSYIYDYPTNTFTFKVPLTFGATENVNVDVLFTSESRAVTSALLSSHLHFQCFKLTVKTADDFATFDDGGDFDQEDVDVFDDVVANNSLKIADDTIDQTTLQIFLGGVLLQAGTDYGVSVTSGSTTIAFANNIGGQNVIVAYRRQALIFVYGLSDIVPGGSTFGVTADTLSTLLSDITNLLNSFEAIFGSQIADVASLIEAATVAANGGNPLLSLFHDEFKEFDGLPLDAPNEVITAAKARSIESQNTKLVGIPFLVDHVLNPTIRLEEGVDYKIVDGSIQSSLDLTASRGKDDQTPGVWWCPIVLLDEQILAKNFGVLLGDVRESSVAYKNALMANLLLRFGGPVVNNIERAAAVILGSPMFMQDGTVQSVTKKVVAYTVTITDDAGSQQQVETLDPSAPRPQVGDRVFPGQSISLPLVTNVVLTQLESWTPGFLTVDTDLGDVRVGDRARLTLYDPVNMNAPPVTAELEIVGVRTQPIPGGARTILSFASRPTFIATPQSVLRIYRDFGPPFAAFEGTVTHLNAVEQVTIATEHETFTLPTDTESEYAVNEPIERGFPVIPSYAQLYNDQRQKNWHWLTVDQVRRHWRDFIPTPTGVAIGVEDKRFVTVTPGTNGRFARAQFSPTYPLPNRGEKVTVVLDGTGETMRFTVIGTDGAVSLLSPTITAEFSGLATIANQPSPKALGRPVEFFEVSPPKSLNGRPQAQLSSRQRVGSAALQVVSTIDFPDAGRVNLVLANGGMVEMEYFSKSDTELLDCQWSIDNPSLTSASGVFNPIIDPTVKVICVAAYLPRILHPAFVSVVKKRVAFDPSTIDGKANVTDDNADQYYAVLKNTIAVLELSRTTEPGKLTDILDEIVPPSSTLEVFTRQVIVDTYDQRPTDSVKTVDPIDADFTVDTTTPP